jgi:hypothetical protein
MSRLLLLNGSPRKKKTSYSFSRTFKMLSEDMGHEAEILNMIDYFKSQNIDNLLENITCSDIIALVAPLYADTLPYPDIWLLEKLYNEHREIFKGKSFFSVGQCGFPDVTRIEPLTNTCRHFAQETDMKWLGSLAYGGGAILNGALLEELGKKGKKIIAAFKLALQNVYSGEMIPTEAQDMITLKIPRIMFRPLAAFLNKSSRKLAKEHGTDLVRKYYLQQ